MKITVTYNNKKIEVEKGTTYLEISKYTDIKDTILGVKKNNEILSLSDKAMEDEIIEFFDYNSPDGSKIYKAALKFIFEVALKTRISKKIGAKTKVTEKYVQFNYSDIDDLNRILEILGLLEESANDGID